MDLAAAPSALGEILLHLLLLLEASSRLLVSADPEGAEAAHHGAVLLAGLLGRAGWLGGRWGPWLRSGLLRHAQGLSKSWVGQPALLAITGFTVMN